ncbi:MAG: antibiotic biosynthesis monooxygenase [Cyanobacteria bacterium P01_F01_bin.150]
MKAKIDHDQHVTAVITHRVRSGRQEGYEDWIKGIAAAAREFEGHLGASILRPQPGQPDYVIVLQFEGGDRLNAWLNSDTRKMWIERVQPLIQEQETVQVLSGLESWFQLPNQAGPKLPKRYKQAILVWLAVMIVALIVGPLADPWLQFLPIWLRLPLDVAITVFLLSYVIMPQFTKWFKRWLFV